jgi:hypothetical protein
MTPSQELIEQECYFIRDLLLEKNRKYGDSAINPVRIFSQADAVEQINVRIDDKLSRISSAQADDHEDAELDLIGYLILKRVAQRSVRIVEHLTSRLDREDQQESAIMAGADFEQLIELIFWDFDAKRKQGSFSERDLFKGCLRSVYRRHNCHDFAQQPHGQVKQQDLDTLKAAATLMPNIATDDEEWQEPAPSDDPAPIDGQQIDHQLRRAHKVEETILTMGNLCRSRRDQAVRGVNA